ncbi:MAG: carbohydrate ABC transporter permease [Treponema sp.]|jgi:ABC-type glycerol-3-phosphate transport system permease component|nr:carbohydrate ABC transporter permease [Treponema sp.]
MTVKRTVAAFIHHAIIIFLLVLTLYPLFFTVITSFKDNERFYQHFWALPDPWVMANYADAFRFIMPYLGNSLIISAASILVILLTTSMAGYAFARLRFPGREVLFMAVLALLMIPSVLQLIPRFILLRDLGLLVPTGIRQYVAIMLGYLGGQQAFSVFIIRSFFDSQPEDLFEAARIDGCNEFRAYYQIAIPLIKPVLATVAVVTLLAIWNDYLWPLIVTTDKKYYTVALGLLQYKGVTLLGTLILYGPLFAGYVVAALPLIIMYIVLMKYFLQGLTAGAIKM